MNKELINTSRRLVFSSRHFRPIEWLHVFVLTTMGVAMPLYSMLGAEKHAPFFFAHQTQPVDLWLLVTGLSFVLPAAVCLILWLLGWISHQLVRMLFAAIVAVLLTATLAPMLTNWMDRADYLPAALALVFALTMTLLYFKTRWVSAFFTVMSLGIVAAPILFMNLPSVKSLMAGSEVRNLLESERTGDLPNIVMIVFDELPLISLLDESRAIDAVRFPNFRRLADAATWYRNTTAVHFSTQRATSAVLIGGDLNEYKKGLFGQSPPLSSVLDRESVPQNLFSMLENDYSIHATELVTHLAPEPVDSADYLPPLKNRFTELIQDVFVIYGHILAPEPSKKYLPHIEGQWHGFILDSEQPVYQLDWPYRDSFGRIAEVRRFFDSLKKRNTPTLYFLHSLLPHYPFVYNLSGQIQHNPFRFLTMHFREASGANNWPDQTTAELVYQAHLLQLGFVDKLLGRILDRLVEQKLYDDSIIILTSDHGTSYFWDSEKLDRDSMVEVQSAGSLYVPLFIKQAGQTQSQVSDRPMQTIDIVPTLADLIEVEVSWPVSGLSALNLIPADRERFAYLPSRFSFYDLSDGLDRALDYKLKLFGSGFNDWMSANGGHQELIGRDLGTFDIEHSDARVQLKNSADFRQIKPDGVSVPGYLEGQITDLPEKLAAKDFQLAIAANGVILATSATTVLPISDLDPEGNRPSWLKTVDDDKNGGGAGDRRDHFFISYLAAHSLEQGKNEISVYGLEVCAAGGSLCLLEFKNELDK